MSISVSETDAGHLYLAALMHRMGMDKLDLSMDEIEAAVTYCRDSGLQMVIVSSDAGATIEFMGEGMCDGLMPDGSVEPGIRLS